MHCTALSSNQRHLWERAKVLVAGVLMQIVSFPHGHRLAEAQDRGRKAQGGKKRSLGTVWCRERSGEMSLGIDTKP